MQRASRAELLGLLHAVQQLALPGEPAAVGAPATAEEGLRRYIADCEARLQQLGRVAHIVREQAWIPASSLVPQTHPAPYAPPSDFGDHAAPASHKRRRLGVDVPGMHGISRWDAGGADPPPYSPTVVDVAATIGSAVAAGQAYGAGAYGAPAPHAYGHPGAADHHHGGHGAPHRSHYDDRDDSRHRHRHHRDDHRERGRDRSRWGP